ncbi:MAG: helix-turn-helix domain-containing protein [Terriglobia bacterium]
MATINVLDGPSHVDCIESVLRGDSNVCGTEEVANSWRRSASEFQVDPSSSTQPILLTETEIRLANEPLGEVIEHATEEIDRLYSIVRHEGAVALICNNLGTALHHRGDEIRADEFKYWGIWEGGIWAEEAEGTNGIGTCIAEERSVSVHRGEHFRTRHTGLSCQGAPIFDSKGRLAAILDVSWIAPPTSDPIPSLNLAATITTARAIEERVFRDSFPRAGFVAAMPADGSGPAVLFAIDRDLRVVGADRAARLAFNLNDQALSEGLLLSRLFEFDPRLFRSRAIEDVAARLMRTGGGVWWHALITPPTRSSSRWIGAAGAALHSLPRIPKLGGLPTSDHPEVYRGGLPPKIAQRVVEYIESNFDKKLTLEDVASRVGYSVHHFAHTFGQSMGIPPHQYVLMRRLDHVDQFLRDTDLPLSEIALRTGFTDQSHMGRHYRRIRGVVPSVARRRYR